MNITGIIRELRNLFLGGCRFGLIFARDRLSHQAHADGFGADLDPADAPIDHGSHLLNIGPELSARDAGDFRSDAAQVLGFATMGHFVAKAGFLSGKMTNAWHCINLVIVSCIEPGIVEKRGGEYKDPAQSS